MSEHSDSSPQRKNRSEDMIKEKQKKLLQSINYQSSFDKGNTAGTQVLMHSYSTLHTLANRFQLKLNVIPTLYGSFEPKPIYLRTDPFTERVISTQLPIDQVRSLIDMIQEYNLKRADTGNIHKSKNQSGLIVPMMITKLPGGDPNEN